MVSLVALAATLAGCASSTPENVNPSSKHPDLGKGNMSQEGTLVVVGPEMAEYEGGGQGVHEANTGPIFAVYDQQGRFIAKTDTGEMTLAPGRYLVRTEPAHGAPSLFWVTVEKGQVTEVNTGKVEEHGKQLRVD